MPARVSQIHSELLIAGNPVARVSQIHSELLLRSPQSVRLSQLHSEVFGIGVPNVRVSQLHTEALGIITSSPILTGNVSEELVFTELFEFIKYEREFEILQFTEQIIRSVTYNRTISETLLLQETVHHKSPRKTVNETLNFTEISRFYQPYGDYTYENLGFIESITIAKIERGGIVEVLEFIETVSYQHINRHPILEESLIFIESATLNKTYYRTISEILMLSEGSPIRTDFGIPDISLPVIQKVNAFVTFEANGVKITLPRPILGDTVSDVDEVKINRAMHGKRYTYVRSSNRQHLNYHFYLPYAKAIELQNFVQSYSSIPILHIDWKGAGWYVKVISNPIERTTTTRSASEISRVDVDIELEGFKLWG